MVGTVAPVFYRSRSGEHAVLLWRLRQMRDRWAKRAASLAVRFLERMRERIALGTYRRRSVVSSGSLGSALLLKDMAPVPESRTGIVLPGGRDAMRIDEKRKFLSDTKFRERSNPPLCVRLIAEEPQALPMVPASECSREDLATERALALINEIRELCGS